MNTSTKILCTNAAIVALLLICPFLNQADAQTVLGRRVIAQGATLATGGGYSMNATIGQAILGRTRSTAHAGFFGFWYDADRSVVAVERLEGAQPDLPAIEALYPNPSRDDVMLLFAMHQPGVNRITLHDMLGRELRLLDQAFRSTGRYAMSFPVSQLSPGLYLIRMNTGGVTMSTRLIVE